MPDWYVKRNSDDSAYPFQIRLGGCEYSLTEEEWGELFDAFFQVNQTNEPLCIESEEYQDLVIMHNDNRVDLRKLLKLERKPFRRF